MSDTKHLNASVVQCDGCGGWHVRISVDGEVLIESPVLPDKAKAIAMGDTIRQVVDLVFDLAGVSNVVAGGIVH